MINILLVILIAIYLSALIRIGIKRDLSEKATKILRGGNIVLLVLLIVLAVAASYNIYLRGYWTTKILIWVFVVSGMVLFVFGNRPMQHEGERAFYGLVFYYPLGIIPLMLIPFIGWGIAFLLYLPAIGNAHEIQYSDNTYRLQYTQTGFMAPAAPPDLFVKRGILEHKEKPLNMHPGVCDSIGIEEIGEKKIRIIFYKTNPTVLEVDVEH